MPGELSVLVKDISRNKPLNLFEIDYHCFAFAG
jgi:hypothetical protein